MKKKTIALCGIAALAGLSLASCSDDSNKGVGSKPSATISTTHNYVEAPGDETYAALADANVDVHVNYNGQSGITYRGTGLTNVVDGNNYKKGDLLPTWKAFEDKLGLTIREASEYTTNKDDATYKLVSGNEYKSDNKTQNIDLFYSATKHINAAGGEGNVVNLLDNLDKMPNFKKFLEANPTIKKTLTTNGAIYYTPYFDGYNDIERMFVMDSSIASKILDAENFDSFDTTINGGATPAANVVQSGSYQPYMNDKYNYEKAQTVKVLVGATEVKEIEIKRTKNIIVQQNELLAEGCTGAELAQQFRTYLNAAFGGNIGEGKVFESYSDIFCSESAAYNADELVALLRVVKANPGVVTGDASGEVQTFFNRGHENNRVDNIADFMQVWGVQGMTSEKDMLYFDASGKLHDAATTPATYEALQNLSAMYDEGLILKEFWLNQGKQNKTAYLDKYFKKNADGSGYGFLMYDYSAATTASNDIVNGVGTDPTTRKIQVEQTGIKPILPPLAYWANTADASQSQALRDFTGKTLMRYAEENRALKSNSWCIPTNSDNKEAALRLMDYMFSEKGAMIQDFGPEAYWQKPDTSKGDTVEGTYDATKVYVANDVVQGQKTPVISDKVLAMLKASGTDFWSFMRENIGNTHGIGCERSKGLDVQATNGYGQIGLTAMKNAIAAGVVELALVDKVKGTYTWHTTVPTAGYPSIATAVSNEYEALTTFWASDKWAANDTGWVKVVTSKAGTDLSNTVLGTAANTGDYNYKNVQDQIEKKNKNYLYQFANSLGESAIPDYAKSN